jgi:hypothetical protein
MSSFNANTRSQSLLRSMIFLLEDVFIEFLVKPY